MANDCVFNIAVWGIGAMGCLFGSHLDAAAGKLSDESKKIEVYLVGRWPEQISALREKGLTVRRCDGRQSRHFLRIVDNPANLPSIDLALILIKSYQTERAARQAATALAADGLAITLQNGLGNLEILAGTVGVDRAGVGVTTYGATLLKPGLLQCGGAGPTHLAKMPHPRLDEQLKEGVFLLRQGGLEVALVDDVDSLVWGKLVLNAAINPVSALLEAPNGELLRQQRYRELMFAAGDEVFRVAKKQNIYLPFNNINARIEQVCRATADNRSSMLQDILNNRPTEIDSISGAVVKLGEQLNMPTPVNAWLWEQVKAKNEISYSTNLPGSSI